MKQPPVQRYQPYTASSLADIRQLDRLSEARRLAMQALAHVLPFRASPYVVDELIDWDDTPEREVDRRPAGRNEPGIVYTPQCFAILTWWSHVLVQRRGGELVELLAQRHHQPGVRNFKAPKALSVMRSLGR